MELPASGVPGPSPPGGGCILSGPIRRSNRTELSVGVDAAWAWGVGRGVVVVGWSAAEATCLAQINAGPIAAAPGETAVTCQMGAEQPPEKGADLGGGGEI